MNDKGEVIMGLWGKIICGGIGATIGGPIGKSVWNFILPGLSAKGFQKSLLNFPMNMIKIHDAYNTVMKAKAG
jgi:hypothetical protein